MSKKRNIEEQIQLKDEQLQRIREMLRQYDAQKKRLVSKKKALEKKQTTDRHIKIGASAERVLGRPFSDKDVDQFVKFLNYIEKNNNMYSRAMNGDRDENTKDTPNKNP